MPLITPTDLIRFLDLPADTQPLDRAQLICDLVIDDITRVAGAALAEPYAAGLKGIALMAAARLWDNPSQLKSDRIDNVSAAYPTVALTKDEEDRVRTCLGAGGPQYSFPEPDWSWKVTTSVLPDLT